MRMVQQTSRSHLARGLAALELLAEGPANATEVASRLGVNRSTGLRLLRELTSLGYVRRDERTKRFRTVSERFLRMGAEESSAEWHELIDPVLERVRNRVGESVVFAAPANGVMVHVSSFPSPHSVAVRERIGTVRPLHASAVGKAWLSALSEEELEAELSRIDFSAGTERAPRDAAELRERLRDARRRGWATDFEEVLPGASCLGAPVVVEGIAVGAASISAPSARMGEEAVATHGPVLLAALADLS